MRTDDVPELNKHFAHHEAATSRAGVLRRDSGTLECGGAAISTRARDDHDVLHASYV